MSQATVSINEPWRNQDWGGGVRQVTPIGDASPLSLPSHLPSPSGNEMAPPTEEWNSNELLNSPPFVPRPEPIFAWLIPLEGENAAHAFQLQPEETVIGRDAAYVHIRLPDETVSGVHAKIKRQLDEEGYAHFMLYDLGSANGTWVDDQQIFQLTLEDEMRFELGQAKVAFKRLH